MASRWTDQLREGMDLYDVDGDKIGSVDEIASGRYLRATTGFLGLGRELYIPMSAISDVRSDGVYLAVDKDDIGSRGWETLPTSRASSSYAYEEVSATPGRADVAAGTRGAAGFEEAG